MSSHGSAKREDPRKRFSGSIGHGIDVSLPAVPEAAPAARSALVSVLAGLVDGRVLADAELLVSELVTNSVQHAGLAADDVVRVGGAVRDGVLRLEVGNPGTAGTIAAREPDLEHGGFGLCLVEALAQAWGVSRGNDTLVWLDLACGPRTSAVPA